MAATYTCGECNGAGYFEHSITCSACHGNGYTFRKFNRAADDHPSARATGGTVESCQAVPPTHSNPVTALSREASSAGQGGAETVTAPPEPIHRALADAGYMPQDRYVERNWE